MDTHTSEQAVRREAIRRRLQGQPRCEICRDLKRAPRWFNKWWREYQANPQPDLADRSRAPHPSPQRLPPEVVQAVVTPRRTLAAAPTPETRDGLIGQRAIQGRLIELAVEPLPSLPRIQRLLQRQELTHPLGAGQARAYYPWPVAWGVHAIHATEIITRQVHGGEASENCHRLDHSRWAVCLSQHADPTSLTTRAHRLKSWAFLGRPFVQQFDHEGAFGGGPTHPRILGQVGRLCWLCSIEPFFTPVYDAKRNYQVEPLHGVWVLGFWSRGEFLNLAHVPTEAPAFQPWCDYPYRPPALEGRTPAQVRGGPPIRKLTPDLRRLIPTGRLPITAGRIHLMRQVNGAGEIELLNDHWPVGSRWIGEYVRATINTAPPRLSIWHQADENADWRLLHTRVFRAKEPVHDLLPAFRRNQARCRDHWPD